MRVSIILLFTSIAAPFSVALAQENSMASAPSFQLEAAYTAEAWSNTGGREDGEHYLDNVGLALTADLETLTGWIGATAHGSILYNNGEALSDSTGDSLVVSNIEAGVEALRLYEAWIEAPVSRSSTLRVGLYDLNSEFDVLDTSALFIGSAHGVGMDIAQTGANGPSIFPITGLAARFDVAVSDGLTFRIAALEGIPGDPDDPAATVLDLDGDEGALIIGEFALESGSSRALLGAWRFTEEFARFDGRGTAPNNGIYLRGERHMSELEVGYVRGFARLGLASGDVNRYSAFASAGLTLETRNSGVFGLAFAHVDTSDRFQMANSGTTSGETVTELTYARAVTDWLEIQPNIQFVSSPSADNSTDDAVVFGVRFTMAPQFRSFGK
jgi:porin